MFNPKTPIQAAGIFLAGIGVIVYTTLDINRTLRQNEIPLTPQQLEALQQYANDVKHRAAVNQLESLAEIRDAYLGLIRQFHPDVSMDTDTTELAAQLNVAYTELMLGTKGSQGEDWEPLDVFDFPEAEPDRLFVNPFACSINPIEWRKLQEVANEGEDPEASLFKAGVSASSAAICYLTPGQLAAVEAELDDMEQALSFEMSAWVLTDCLSRARLANQRMPVRGRAS